MPELAWCEFGNHGMICAKPDAEFWYVIASHMSSSYYLFVLGPGRNERGVKYGTTEEAKKPQSATGRSANRNCARKHGQQTRMKALATARKRPCSASIA